MKKKQGKGQNEGTNLQQYSWLSAFTIIDKCNVRARPGAG
jgi:hypothetical protein